VVAIGAPLVSQGANDVEAVVTGGIGAGRGPGAAVVVDFDADEVASADEDADCEGAAGQAGVAVERSIGGKFGGAEDHVVCDRAVVQ